VNGGGIRDPELGDASSWQTTAMTFDEDAINPGDGTATRLIAGHCGRSALRQTIDMPELADAEQFVVQAMVTSNDVIGMGCDARPTLWIGDARCGRRTRESAR
jgi:hypothetical protein